LQGYAIDRVDFVSYARDISHRSGSGPPDAFNGDLIMLIDVVQGSISGEECGSETAVLYELDSDAFTDG
jgi:hypothetical protein